MFRSRQSSNESSTLTTTTTETCVVTAATSPQFSTLTVVAESHTSTMPMMNSEKELELNKSREGLTFFTRLNNRFQDIKLTENNGIPSEHFLECCSDLFSILDNFGSTAFLPVKIDVYGNINVIFKYLFLKLFNLFNWNFLFLKKLKQKYSQNPEKYATLQSMIQHEVDENLTQVRNSATDALMWLRRALGFIAEYMHEFSRSYTSIPSECLYAAYQLTLRQYHNWVVRGIFSLAMRSMPTNEDFIKSLLASPDDYNHNKHTMMTIVSFFFYSKNKSFYPTLNFFYSCARYTTTRSSPCKESSRLSKLSKNFTRKIISSIERFKSIQFKCSI
jgi:hypothetical protein